MNLEEIRTLAEIMSQNGLTAIEITEGETNIRLERNSLCRLPLPCASPPPPPLCRLPRLPLLPLCRKPPRPRPLPPATSATSRRSSPPWWACSMIPPPRRPTPM